MDIIDKIFSKMQKERVPNDLKAKLLALPKEKSESKPWKLFSFLPVMGLKFVMPIVLVMALTLGLYYQYVYLPVPQVRASFELSPEKSDSAGVPVNGVFILKSSTHIASRHLKKSISFEPAVDFEVEDLGENMYRIVPNGLTGDVVYSIVIPEGLADRDYSWAYQVKAEFQVISTVPGKNATFVPVNSGVEVTFNREGFVEPEKYFSISPDIAGSFEQYGSLLIFKPKKALEQRKVYTVTVKAGMGVASSDDKLKQDYSFSFETSDDNQYQKPFDFEKDFNQSFDKKPVIQVARNYYYSGDQVDRFKGLKVQVFKFNGPDEFLESYNKSRDWKNIWTYFARNAGSSEIDAKKMNKVAEFEPVVQNNDRAYYFEFPQEVTEGYYLIVGIGRNGDKEYQWFQKTNLSHYAAFSYEKSFAWVYDFATKKPVVDAGVVSINTNNVLGKTSSAGLAEFVTPKEFLEGGSGEGFPNIVKLEARGYNPYFILDFGRYDQRSYSYIDFRGRKIFEPSKYWEYVSTDRPIYQPSDKVNFWGVIKSRDDEQVVGKELTVGISNGFYYGFWETGTDAKPSLNEDLPLVQTKVKVSELGNYEGVIDFSGLKPDYYTMFVREGNTVISRTTIHVFSYSKPGYQLSLSPEHRKYFEGDEVVYKAKLAFFDGTPVSKVELSYSGYFGKDVTGEVRTNGKGEAEIKFIVPKADGVYNYPRYYYLNVSPKRSEEASIYTSSNIAVYGPKIELSVKNEMVKDGTNNYTAKISKLSFGSSVDGLSREIKKSPEPGRQVSAEIRKISYVKVPAKGVSVYYDYITKTVQQIYDYERQEVVVETVKGVTDTAGEWKFSKKFPYEENVYYSVIFSASDDGGKVVNYYSHYSFNTSNYSYQPYTGLGYGTANTGRLYPSLRVTGRNENDYHDYYSVGEKFGLDVNLSDANISKNNQKIPVIIYRFGRNIDRVNILDGYHFDEVFSEEFKPQIGYKAVVFGPYGFEETDQKTIGFKIDDAKLNIKITPDKDKYTPGSEVKLSVKVLDAKNEPVRASVNINVIDEALFAVEENYAENLLDRLYKYVIDTPGVSYTLYDLLNPNPGDGYGGGGGEARVKFEDTALARSVVTDRNGNAEVKFKLPDNLTSWRVISAAFEPERVLGGTNKQNIIATLPFFVDAVISPTYLVGDEPNIKVRLFGGNYSADVPSDLEITSESLGVSVKKTVKGSDLYVALPKLPVGIHEVKMVARQGEKQDILVRKIVVKNSYFTRQETATLNLDNDLLGLNGAKEGLTKVLVSDDKLNKLYDQINALVWSDGARIDQKVSGYVAKKLLSDVFKVGENPENLDLSYYFKNGGLGLLVYGDSDLEVSALVANAVPDKVAKNDLIRYFETELRDQKADIHRVVRSLYGLAALKQPVLSKLQVVRTDKNLELEDKLFVANALAVLGDKEGARILYLNEISKDVVSKDNSKYLDLKDKTKSVKRTALLGVLLAQLQIETDFDLVRNYLDSNYPEKDLDVLERVLMMKYAVQFKNTNTLEFKLATNNGEKVVKLKPGEIFSFDVMAKDLASVRFTNVKGGGKVRTVFDVEGGSEIKRTGEFSVIRRYLVDGKETTVFREGELVQIILTVKPKVEKEYQSYEIVDYLPSGLGTVTPTLTPDYGSYLYPSCSYSNLSYPVSQDGKKSTFVGYTGGKNDPCYRPNVEVVYYARVVSTGKFKANPVKVNKFDDTVNIAVSAEGKIEIKE